MAFEPFSDEALEDLVRLQSNSVDLRVVTHEGVQKEFKESFTWGSIGAYARTMAAFANARGGYLIFGVTDRPRIAKGLTESGRQSFDELDRAKLTNGLNDIFAPEIHWDSSLYSVGTVTLGLIYVFESDNKPVIARKARQQQNGNLLEGDILYRYNSRTERAKFPEIKRIIDDAKYREQRSMMLHIEELVKAGASNAAVLDFNSNTLQGPTGERVLVAQELLEKISFIREGEFSETVGAPTLRLIGDVVPTHTINLGSDRVTLQAITTERLIKDFLTQADTVDPREYIRQAASGNTAFVPIHFYRQRAELKPAELVDFVTDINTRSQAKSKLLKRLRANDALISAPPSTSPQYATTVERREYFEMLISGEVPDEPIVDQTKAKAFAEALRSLDNASIGHISDSLLVILSDLMDRHYVSSGSVADQIRRAICRVDIALFGT